MYKSHREFNEMSHADQISYIQNIVSALTPKSTQDLYAHLTITDDDDSVTPTDDAANAEFNCDLKVQDVFGERQFDDLAPREKYSFLEMCGAKLHQPTLNVRVERPSQPRVDMSMDLIRNTMLHMPLQELLRTCSASVAASNICRSKKFWLQRMGRTKPFASQEIRDAVYTEDTKHVYQMIRTWMTDQQQTDWYHNSEFQRIVEEIITRLDIMMRCKYSNNYVALNVPVRNRNLYIDKNYNDVRDKLHTNPHYKILEMYKDHIVPKTLLSGARHVIFNHSRIEEIAEANERFSTLFDHIMSKTDSTVKSVAQLDTLDQSEELYAWWCRDMDI